MTRNSLPRKWARPGVLEAEGAKKRRRLVSARGVYRLRIDTREEELIENGGGGSTGERLKRSLVSRGEKRGGRPTAPESSLV